MSTKLTKFEGHRIDSLISEINAALKPIQEKYGLKDLKLGRVSYSAAEFKTSMHVKIGAEDSQAAVKRMEQLSKAIGFEENIYGRKIYGSDGEQYKVVDINTRKSKYPIIGERVSDPSKRLLFTAKVRFMGETQPKRTIDQFTNNNRIIIRDTLGQNPFNR